MPNMHILVFITLALKFAVAMPQFDRAANYRTRNVIDKPWELAQFDLDPFNLTHMCVDCKKDNRDPLFGCSIKFTWSDPNANQSCTCNESWQWDGVTTTQGSLNNYSTSYLVCKDNKAELFQFKIMDIFDLSNFSLSLTHMYHDSKDFPTSTIVNMFAQPNITLQMVEKSNISMTYSSPPDSSIEANITGMTI
ncbi:hypothetical protein F4819DRAFT_481391 [Hypoxylon fuscum]|nr:hypothetical protein F4819DRAFT_481391 [Hypoxylon fuscum]